MVSVTENYKTVQNIKLSYLLNLLIEFSFLYFVNVVIYE